MKTTAFVMFPPPYLQRDALFASSVPQLVAAYQDGRYANRIAIQVDLTDGEAIAEELFDLSNNPSRQDERDAKYGQFRSLSTGDIVKVGTDAYLCQSIGWEKL